MQTLVSVLDFLIVIKGKVKIDGLRIWGCKPPKSKKFSFDNKAAKFGGVMVSSVQWHDLKRLPHFNKTTKYHF